LSCELVGECVHCVAPGGHGCISIFLRSLERVATPTAPIVLYNIFPVGTRAWYQCACRAKISSPTVRSRRRRRRRAPQRLGGADRGVINIVRGMSISLYHAFFLHWTKLSVAICIARLPSCVHQKADDSVSPGPQRPGPTLGLRRD
jgi:hypothetical protein